MCQQGTAEPHERGENRRINKLPLASGIGRVSLLGRGIGIFFKVRQTSFLFVFLVSWVFFLIHSK